MDNVIAFDGYCILIRKILRKYNNFTICDNCRLIRIELTQNGNKYPFINILSNINVMILIPYMFNITSLMMLIHITLLLFVTECY